jgi:hypothetical protein
MPSQGEVLNIGGGAIVTTKSWALVNDAEHKSRCYENGVGSYAEAVFAIQAAELWLDEGPEDGDDLDELHAVLADASRRVESRQDFKEG